MDLELYFFLAILMAVGTIIIRKLYGGKIAANIKEILILAAILPIILIAAFGMLDMLNAETEATYDIADNTISEIIDYSVQKIPYIIVSDAAGILVGAVLAPFVRIK